jgi:acyl carrier protein
MRRYLGQKLPEYMIPAAYVGLEKLPLTASGKVDRKGLPAAEAWAYGSGGYQAPIGEMEVEVAGIWTELLKMERVGRQDNFFELGGHSLLATQFVSRVRETFEVELPLRSLFETPRIADLTTTISQLQLTTARDGSPIKRSERGEKNIEELVAELEHLSDDEAQALLAEEMNLAGRNR